MRRSWVYESQIQHLKPQITPISQIGKLSMPPIALVVVHALVFRTFPTRNPHHFRPVGEASSLCFFNPEANRGRFAYSFAAILSMRALSLVFMRRNHSEIVRQPRAAAVWETAPV